MNDTASILIVDDNPNNLQMLAAILQKDGFKVRPALSGELALRAIQSHSPDLILLDVRMPGMDGYETCRRIKADEQQRHIPVIFISALTEIEEKLHAFRSGAVDYITKPFQSDEVLARVRTQMELAQTRKALAETNGRLLALMDHLVQAEKRKSLGVLAYGVAHELNTPIGNAILGASTIDELLSHFSGKDKPAIDELLATCRSGTQIVLRNLSRAGKMIDSLSEVSVDGASERRRSIHLYDAVHHLIAVMPSLRGKPVSVTIDIDPALTIETFPGRLEQILENIIENAVIHGFEDASSGTIRIVAHTTPGDSVSLQIGDNGRGISPDHLKLVFDPFFTTLHGEGGHGLGLHIAYNLITGILGGTVSVSSTERGGTEFSLNFPLVAPGAAGHAQPDSVANAFREARLAYL
jgi:signal transduction histidine kinase